MLFARVRASANKRRELVRGCRVAISFRFSRATSFKSTQTAVSALSTIDEQIAQIRKEIERKERWETRVVRRRDVRAGAGLEVQQRTRRTPHTHTHARTHIGAESFFVV
eukprot:6184215-Pleurochrysis_carterae.AAC.1